MRGRISANNEAKAQLAKLYFEVKIRLGLDSNAFAMLCASAFFFVGFVHCSWDSQVWNSANITLKLSPTALFTHLKIILL